VNRWFRLGSAVVAMIMIANFQYAWSLFVKPLMGAHEDLKWKLSDVQWAFSIFIACQTWFLAPSGWFIDKVGPRMFVTLGGILCGAGWALLSTASSLSALYFYYAATGVGAALVYCGSMGVALKWFPDRRGLAAGLTAAAYGAGAALFIPMIAGMLKSSGFENTLVYTGLFQGLVIVIAAQFLRNPQVGEVAAPVAATKVVRTRGENFTPAQMMRTSHFYFMYAAMFIMGVGGLMVTAQLTKLADSFKITAAAVTLAATLNPIANGVSRLSWGWVSDHLGRERTMVIAFIIQAIALVSVPLLAPGSDTLFIVTLMLVYYSWGEIYSLFPSMTTDLFGTRNASANYGFVYSTKGLAAIVGGGVAAMLYEKLGSWDVVFYGGAVLALVSAVIAYLLGKMPAPRIPAPVEEFGGVPGAARG
jgi:OFA family oxalate/formate antiporter-like MFS transporter